MTFQSQLELIPEGASFVIFNDSKYLVTKEILQNGKIIKVYAKSLQNSDFISFNYYLTGKEVALKPCEMSVEKVQDFVSGMLFVED